MSAIDQVRPYRHPPTFTALYDAMMDYLAARVQALATIRIGSEVYAPILEIRKERDKPLVCFLDGTATRRAAPVQRRHNPDHWQDTRQDVTDLMQERKHRRQWRTLQRDGLQALDETDVQDVIVWVGSNRRRVQALADELDTAALDYLLECVTDNDALLAAVGDMLPMDLSTRLLEVA